MAKVVGIIPARYNSSRFPGKAIANLNGKPMVWHVYHQAKKSCMLDDLFIATDDDRIVSVCSEYHLKCLLTSKEHVSGSDRVVECSRQIDADFYVNIQGDEPMIDPITIDILVKKALSFDRSDEVVVNCFAKINSVSDIEDTNIVKVILTASNNAIAFSRYPIPYSKDNHSKYFKQLGLYVFSKKALNAFKNMKIGPIEKSEGIEMYRFLENDKNIQMVKVNDDSISVDTPSDLKRVADILKA